MKNIQECQHKIETVILNLGGYWRPLSGLARLLEELGELGDAMLKKNRVGIEHELADIFIISTCLANQYCTSLREGYKELNIPTNVNNIRQFIKANGEQDIYYKKLVSQSTEISRLINYYEGGKELKTDEPLTNLTIEVAKVHNILFEISDLLKIDLFRKIEDVLKYNMERDIHRFNKTQDPSVSTTLKNFKDVIRNTDCIFAISSKLWGAYPYKESLTLEKNIENSIPLLRRFNRCSGREKLDGFIFEVRGQGIGDNINQLANSFMSIITTIVNNDQSGVNCLNGDILSPKWKFTFEGEIFFITTFAPCYPSKHPRYSYKEDSTFIFMQPYSSFLNNGISSGNPKREDIKNIIRDKFEKNSKTYDVDLVKQPLEALKFVKPINENDLPVQWWR